jgi:hypothetical protein
MDGIALYSHCRAMSRRLINFGRTATTFGRMTSDKRSKIICGTLVIVMLSILLTACAAKPWTYKDGWISDEPYINFGPGVVTGSDKSSDGGVLKDAQGNEIEIEVTWAPSSREMLIYRYNAQSTELNDNDMLLKGTFTAKKNTFALKITQDNVYGNTFNEITFTKK